MWTRRPTRTCSGRCAEAAATSAWPRRFKFRLQPVNEILGGILVLPAEPSVIASFVAEAQAAPDELSTIANVMTAPPMPFLPAELHGRPIVLAFIAYAGPPEEGERAVAPLRALTTPLADMVRPMTYPELYSFEPEAPEDFHPIYTSRTQFAESVDESAAAAIVESVGASSAMTAVAQLRVVGGAMARVPADATAFAHRSVSMMINVAAIYENPDERPQHTEWVSDLSAQLLQEDDGAYVGFLGDVGEEAGARRLSGRDLGPAGGGQGEVRPGQPLPAEPEHPAGLAVAERHAPERAARVIPAMREHAIPARGQARLGRASRP